MDRTRSTSLILSRGAKLGPTIHHSVKRNCVDASPLLKHFSGDGKDDPGTDGILRKADLPVVETERCQRHIQDTYFSPRSNDFEYICAGGGGGSEESCFVSTMAKQLISFFLMYINWKTYITLFFILKETVQGFHHFFHTWPVL